MHACMMHLLCSPRNTIRRFDVYMLSWVYHAVTAIEHGCGSPSSFHVGIAAAALKLNPCADASTARARQVAGHAWSQEAPGQHVQGSVALVDASSYIYMCAFLPLHDGHAASARCP